MELILTKPDFDSQEVLDSGLISRVVKEEVLEDTCLDMLRQLAGIPGKAIAETRRMLQPDITEVIKFIDSSFERSPGFLHK